MIIRWRTGSQIAAAPVRCVVDGLLTHAKHESSANDRDGSVIAVAMTRNAKANALRLTRVSDRLAIRDTLSGAKSERIRAPSCWGASVSSTCASVAGRAWRERPNPAVVSVHRWY